MISKSLATLALRIHGSKATVIKVKSWMPQLEDDGGFAWPMVLVDEERIRKTIWPIWDKRYLKWLFNLKE